MGLCCKRGQGEILAGSAALEEQAGREEIMSNARLVFVGSLNREVPIFQAARGRPDRAVAVYGFDRDGALTSPPVVIMAADQKAGFAESCRLRPMRRRDAAGVDTIGRP